MAFKSKRERWLATIVGLAVVVAGTVVSARLVNDLLGAMDEEISIRQNRLDDLRTTFNNLEGIEERFAGVVRELRIPGELSQQRDRVLRDLVDLIGAAGISDNYDSVRMEEQMEAIEDEFYVVRLAVDGIRCDQVALPKFLYLVDRRSTMEVETVELRSTGRGGDDTLRANVRVMRLIPTREFMKGIDET